MDECGFRVCLSYEQLSEIKKYYVYVDLARCKIVWDLENHIRSTFNIRGDVTLLIGDVTLPRNESIKVIRPDDVLRLEFVEPDSKFSTPNAAIELNKIFTGAWSEVSKPNLLESPEIPVREEKKNVEKKKRQKIAPYSGIGSFLQMLKSERKEEPERDLSFEPPSVQKLKTKCSESPPVVVDLVNEEAASEESEQKRKRKRKHKRKNQEDASQSDSLTDSKKSETFSPIVQPRVQKHNKHTFFNDMDDTTSTPKENPGSCQVVLNGTDGNRTPEKSKRWNDRTEKGGEGENNSTLWKENLISLVNRPAEEKVFTRDDLGSGGGGGQEGDEGSCASVEIIGPQPPPPQSGKDLDPSMYPIIPSVRTNDVIIFKVLTLGQDYCPIISKHVMGKVKSEDEETGELSILILRGSEEFSQSSGGRLSLSGEADGERKVNGCRTPHIERLRFKDLIEPRLVFP